MELFHPTYHWISGRLIFTLPGSQSFVRPSGVQTVDVRVSGLARESQPFSFGAVGPMIENVVRGCPGGLLVRCVVLGVFFFVKGDGWISILRSKLFKEWFIVNFSTVLKRMASKRWLLLPSKMGHTPLIKQQKGFMKIWGLRLGSRCFFSKMHFTFVQPWYCCGLPKLCFLVSKESIIP